MLEGRQTQELKIYFEALAKFDSIQKRVLICNKCNGEFSTCTCIISRTISKAKLISTKVITVSITYLTLGCFACLSNQHQYKIRTDT